jgi:ribosome-associated toxin RatA of RatAB toxin-antitoxin module
VKELQGSASAEIELPAEDCFALVASIDRYPGWFEVIRAVEVLKRRRNGLPSLARVELHVPQSPFGTDFELLVLIDGELPEAMQFTKLPADAADQDRLELIWRLRENGNTEIEFEFDAAVSFVPGYLPVGSAGDAIAEAILNATAAVLTPDPLLPPRAQR